VHPALVVTFALEELRQTHGAAAAGPHDTAPFRAFRARLLEAAARLAVAPAALSFWWEGTFNGYSLAVEVLPAEALPGFGEAAAAACPVESVRLAPARGEGYPLALVEPGGAVLRRDAGGLLVEAPFGAPAGHFGAPGARRIP